MASTHQQGILTSEEQLLLGGVGESSEKVNGFCLDSRDFKNAASTRKSQNIHTKSSKSSLRFCNVCFWMANLWYFNKMSNSAPLEETVIHL